MDGWMGSLTTSPASNGHIEVIQRERRRGLERERNRRLTGDKRGRQKPRESEI